MKSNRPFKKLNRATGLWESFAASPTEKMYCYNGKRSLDKEFSNTTQKKRVSVKALKQPIGYGN